MTSTSSAVDALAYLRKESLDVYSRLHSIAEDIQFVEHVRNYYPNLPILRAGSLVLFFRIANLIGKSS